MSVGPLSAGTDARTTPVRGLVAGTAPFSAVDGTGNRFVVFLQGCEFDCLTCHNPMTIPLRPTGMQPVTARRAIDPIVESAPFLTGVTITGGEPTAQPDFLVALLGELAAHPDTAHLSRFVDSNGDAPVELWQRLAPLLDGAMIDLKALDGERHLVLTGRENTRVLEAVDYLQSVGKLEEVRLLLVPGLNDDDAQLARTARWLLARDPEMRVRVNAYRRHGTRACARFLLEVTDEDRSRYREVLTAAGVRHLSIG